MECARLSTDNASSTAFKDENCVPYEAEFGLNPPLGLDFSVLNLL